MRRIAPHVAAFLILLVVAIVAGFYLGATPGPAPSPEISDDVAGVGEPPADSAETAPADTPVFFYANTWAGADMKVVAEEVRMAADAGIHRFILTVPLPWASDPDAVDRAVDVVSRVVDVDAAARVTLRVKLDPPQVWLEEHPDARAETVADAEARVVPASVAWREDAKKALDTLLAGLDEADLAPRIRAFVIACFDEGAWRLSDGYDSSEANTQAFREWLAGRYEDDKALRDAWKDGRATLEKANVPGRPDTNGTDGVFFTLPDDQRQVDYLEFVSSSIPGAIAEFTEHIKSIAGAGTRVLAAYGHSFEVLANDAGHLGLGEALDSGLDGFLSPVSYTDRGLGGAGGFMGPIDSARLHGKSWWLVDDTRTGLARDTATGWNGTVKSVVAEDVYNVQARNFSAALTHGLGMVWADAQGTGQLADPIMWRRFGSMNDAYRGVGPRLDPAGVQSLDEGLRAPVFQSTLAVVVDEAARRYQRLDRDVNAVLLRRGADCALRAGVPTRFYLLRDVLDGRAAPADVYLFLNAFHLTPDERVTLHERFAQRGAAAIWMYAPGYFDGETASAENISATTGLTVKAFDGAAQAGSVCQLSERWVRENERFGDERAWQPLFYIDNATNVVAKYADSNQTSAAIEFLEAGWTSVYIAEPGLAPSLLREILMILEQPICFRVAANRYYDVTHFGPNLIALHANTTGERLIEFPVFCDVTDLIDPAVGWPNKRSLVLPLRVGETRLLELTPVQ